MTVPGLTPNVTDFKTHTLKHLCRSALEPGVNTSRNVKPNPESAFPSSVRNTSLGQSSLHRRISSHSCSSLVLLSLADVGYLSDLPWAPAQQCLDCSLTCSDFSLLTLVSQTILYVSCLRPQNQALLEWGRGRGHQRSHAKHPLQTKALSSPR